jgi:hypothetical protein
MYVIHIGVVARKVNSKDIKIKSQRFLIFIFDGTRLGHLQKAPY